eukprot:g5278.t1
MMEKLKEVADVPEYWDIRAPYPQHSAFPEMGSKVTTAEPTPAPTPEPSEDELSESTEEEDIENTENVRIVEKEEKVGKRKNRSRQSKKNTSSDSIATLAEKREVEKRIPQIPGGGVMGELRHILQAVEKGTLRKIEKNWPVMKYGFRVHNMNMNMADIMTMFKSFTGFDSYRAGDLARLERALKIHLVPEAERTKHFITYEEFVRKVGPRDEEAGETEGHEPIDVSSNRLLSKAYDDPKTQKEQVLEKLDRLYDKRTKNMPQSYRTLLAQEILSSGMADPQQWANIALKSTMMKLEKKAAKQMQRGMRGWVVRHRIQKQKERKRMQFYLNLFLGKMKSTTFHQWHVAAELQIEIRQRCWQPVRRWRKWAKIQKDRKEMLRLCYWPMHVWRRYTVKCIDARLKAKVLKGVWEALTVMRCLRAWNKFVHYRFSQEEKIKMQHQRNGMRLKRLVFQAIERYKERSLRIKRKVHEVHTQFHSFMMSCIAGWRYYTVGRRVLPSLALKYRWILPQDVTVTDVCEAALSKLPSFPSPSDLGVCFPWRPGQDVEKNKKAVEWVCSRMREKFQKKLSHRTRVLWCQTRWIVPRVINQWHAGMEIYALERRIRYLGYMNFLKRLFLSFRKGIIVAKDERGELLSIQKRREERLQRGKEAAEAYNLQWEKDELWRKEGMANVRSMQLELLQVIRTRRRNTNALKLHTQRIQHEREMIRKAAELVVQGKVKSMEEAMAKTMNRGKSLHANRMEMLKATLERVIRQLEHSNSWKWVKKTFNRLKLVIRQKKSMSRYKRARLANWLRVCVRLDYLNRAMPAYHRLRMKWSVLNRWLMFLDQKYTIETPGLGHEIKRRTFMASWWSRYILKTRAAQAFLGRDTSMYIEDDIRHSAMHTLTAIFARWSAYVQERVCLRKVVALRHTLLEMRLKQRVLDGWFTAIKAEHTYKTRRAHREEDDLCFWMRRVIADIDQWKCKYLIPRSKFATSKLVKQRANLRRRIFDDSLNNHFPTIKKRIVRFKKEIKMRVRQEQRLLCLAFQQRLMAKWGDRYKYGPYHEATKVDIKDRNNGATESGKAKKKKKKKKKNKNGNREGRKSPTAAVTKVTAEDLLAVASPHGSPSASAFRKSVGLFNNDKKDSEREALQGIPKGKRKSVSPKGSPKGKRKSIEGEKDSIDEGVEFVEPGPAEDGENPLQLSEVVIYYDTSKDNGGILGIARILRCTLPDGTVKTVRGLQHGQGEAQLGVGNGVERESFRLSAGEKLVGIKGYVSKDRSRGVGMLRFTASSGRVSPWYGNDKTGSQEPFELIAEPPQQKSAKERMQQLRIENEAKEKLDRTGRRRRRRKKTSNSPTAASPGRGRKKKAKSVKNINHGENEKGSNDGSKGYIVGFCGRSTEKRLLSLGMVARQKNPPNVLGECWTNIDPNHTEQMHKAEGEFAVLLRMRACELFSLLDRAEQIAIRMRGTAYGRKKIDSVTVATSMARWFFEALSKSLVKVPTRSMEAAANEIRLRGQVQLRRGKELVDMAESMLADVEGYNPATGTAKLSPALFGLAYVRQAKRKMEMAESSKRQGLVMISRGQTLTQEADSLLPQLDASPDLRNYYQGLYKLAKTANTLSPKEEDLLSKYDFL